MDMLESPMMATKQWKIFIHSWKVLSILHLMCTVTCQIDLEVLSKDYHNPSLPSLPSFSSNPESRPIITSTNQNITVGPGERAVMKCKVENLGTKTVTWRKESDIHPLTIGAFSFAPDSRMSVDHNSRNSEWSFIIHDVKPSDEGVYHCQISTKNGNYSQAIRLNVKTIRVTGLEYVERGSTIQLTCNVTGKPEPPNNIDWYMGNRKVEADASRGIIITKKIETRVLVSMLTIKNSQPTDTGKYTCKSSEEESSSISVHVLNVPSPETEISDSSTNERLSGFFFKNDTTLSATPSILLLLTLFLIIITSTSVLSDSLQLQHQWLTR